MRKESGDHPKKVFINDESDAKILKIKKGTESIIDLLNEKIIGL